MTKKLLTLLITAACFSFTSYAADSIVPYGNGTWVHDYLVNDQGGITSTHAGHFFAKLKSYNTSVSKNPACQITEVFAYGGTLEIHNPGAGKPYLPNHFAMEYYPQRIFHISLNNWKVWPNQIDSGYYSVHAYSHLTVDGNPHSKKVLNLMQINGSVGAVNVHGLQLLNGLSQTDAAHFADFVAAQVCADDALDGVQFDLEPTSLIGSSSVVTGNGQQYFYAEIAKDFAGHIKEGKDDPINCVDSNHHQGRIFSVFTSASGVQEAPQAMAKILTQYGNGYVIDSLYDLSGQPAGTINPPDAYRQQVETEVSTMVELGNKYHIPYQFAVPVAASAHEFENKNKQATGYKQGEYVKIALAIINQHAQGNAYYKGLALWGWNDKLIVADPNGNKKFFNLEPGDPSKAIDNSSLTALAHCNA